MFTCNSNFLETRLVFDMCENVQRVSVNEYDCGRIDASKQADLGRCQQDARQCLENVKRDIDISKVRQMGVSVGYPALISAGVQVLRAMSTEEIITLLTGLAASGYLTVQAVNSQSSKYQFFQDKSSKTNMHHLEDIPYQLTLTP